VPTLVPGVISFTPLYSINIFLQLFQHLSLCYLASLTMVSVNQTNIMSSEDEKKDHINSASVDFPIESGMKEQADSAASPEKLEQWNSPRINLYRYLATLYSFIIMGMNDAAYGVSLPRYPSTPYFLTLSRH
jgi:hypothetical protein